MKASPVALRYQILAAARACEEKKAHDISILQMAAGTGIFTDYFVICSGGNPRQVQAIADEVKDRLQIAGLDPAHSEGYNQAEWILLDYVDLVVHIFSERARRYYDLERLWKSARRLRLEDLQAASRTAKPAKRAAEKRVVARHRTTVKKKR